MVATSAWPKDLLSFSIKRPNAFIMASWLALTLYSPKSHKLTVLRFQAERLAPELIEATPRMTGFEQRCFEWLWGAYVVARYSRHSKISLAELDWLNVQVA